MKETTFCKDMTWGNFITRLLVSSGALSTALALSLCSYKPTSPVEVQALGYEPTASSVESATDTDVERLRQLICTVFAAPDQPITHAARQFGQFTIGTNSSQIEVVADPTTPTLVAGVYAEDTDGAEVLLPLDPPLDLESCDTQ